MEIKNVDNGQEFDFGKTAASYAEYRDIYPKELYDRLRLLGVAADGTDWLDLGTGTGVLPKNLYNPNARITGVDVSVEQIAFARKYAEENGLSINYIVSPAESTGLPEHSFDAITAAQCFWYFDREKMRDEIRRLLKPGGVFIKIVMDWDLADSISARSIGIVSKHNPCWTGGKGVVADICDDLFPGRQTESFYTDLRFTRESWHGRMRACRGTLASMDEKTFADWEAEHLTTLAEYPDEFTVRHIVYYTYFYL